MSKFSKPIEVRVQVEPYPYSAKGENCFNVFIGPFRLGHYYKLSDNTVKFFGDIPPQGGAFSRDYENEEKFFEALTSNTIRDFGW